MAHEVTGVIARAKGAPVELTTVVVPDPGPGEALVRIQACGVCHTDLHAAAGDWPVKPALPFIPGHEAVGVVTAVGAGVSYLEEGGRGGRPWKKARERVGRGSTIRFSVSPRERSKWPAPARRSQLPEGQAPLRAVPDHCSRPCAQRPCCLRDCQSSAREYIAQQLDRIPQDDRSYLGGGR